MTLFNYLSRNKKEKIELILIQKLTAMEADKDGNNKAVVEEAQKRLEHFRPKDVLLVLYHIRDVERGYEPAVNKEIKRYESITK